MTQPPDNSRNQQETANAAILLIGSAADQRKFQLALDRVDEITINGTRKTGTQTGIQLSIPADVDAIAYLKSVVTTLPGVSVLIQGVMVKTIPTVVCKASSVRKQSGGRLFGLLPQRVISPSTYKPPTRAPQPTSFRTEVEGIRREVVQEPEPPRPTPVEVARQSRTTNQNIPVTPSTLFTSVFFLFGDLELGYAKLIRSSSRNKTLQNASLTGLANTTVTNSLAGLMFMFGDLEVGIRKVRRSRSAFSFKRITEVSMIFGVASHLISELAGSLFGTDTSDDSKNQNTPKQSRSTRPDDA